MYRALLKLIIEVDIGILFFKGISIKVIKFLLLGGKGRKGINTVDLVLLYKTIGFLFNS